MAYKEMQQKHTSPFENEIYELSFSGNALSSSPSLASTHYRAVASTEPDVRCGLRIYDNHRGLWLTLDPEESAAYGFNNSTTKFPGETNFWQHLSSGSSSARTETREESRKEHMFDKPLTPSDVGKLNRLVIPKQNAERYFPIDSAMTEKGLLLSFEDSNAKPWSFRYSYWNSSQSYVLTKGWSRFVKENRLDAGDIVSFQRRAINGGTDWQLLIGCRHRADIQPLQPAIPGMLQWNPPQFDPAPVIYVADQHPRSDRPDRPETGVKRLRLFGVNLECPDGSENE